MNLNDEVLEKLCRLANPPHIILDWEDIASILDTKFRWSGSKINWDETRNHTCYEYNRADKVKLLLKNNVKGLVDAMAEANEVYYINDSSLDFGLIIDSSSFYDIVQFLVDNVPQHHYFFDKKGSWCLAITSEGYIDFAYSL